MICERVFLVRLGRRSLLVSALLGATALSVAGPAAAQTSTSATWSSNPSSGDWNNPSNWQPTQVPNGPNATATFDLTTNPLVALSANTQVASVTFNAAAVNPYMITASSGLLLTISGAGVVNNSARTQNFVADDNATGARGLITFTNSATAESSAATTFTNNKSSQHKSDGGYSEFRDNSKAGNAAFVNNGGLVANSYGGVLQFSQNASAGTSTITDNPGTATFRSTTFGASGGLTEFNDFSTAGDATIANLGGDVQSMLGGKTAFYDTANASNATTTGFGGGTTFLLNASSAVNPAIINTNRGEVEFEDSTTASNSTLTGNDQFNDNSTAGNAKIVSNSVFAERATAGNATIIINTAQLSSFSSSSTGSIDTIKGGPILLRSPNMRPLESNIRRQEER